MTVAELIAELQKMPPHAPVWIQMILALEPWDDDSTGSDGVSSVVASTVTWQGNHVEIE